MAANHPDLARGCAEDVWWRREAQPQMHAWSDDQPVRLGDKTGPAKAPAGNAVAGDGLDGPTANQRLVRCGRGRPVRVVTCALLAWLAVDCTAPGQRALLRLWDHASWHVSQAVQAWSNTHHRHAQQAGGCRVMIWRFPSQSPWRNPIEPTWVHGKRAVVEPVRVLAMAELIQRVCAYDHCELTDPIAQPDC
jgi:hypothetical protein